MLIFHDEYAFRRDRQVLAILLMTGSSRLINFEMRSQVINFDHTQIIFLDNTTMRRDILRRRNKDQTK